MADTTAASASQVKAKPERPDEEQYKTNLAKAQKEHKASEDHAKSINSKLDLTRPNNKDSPSAKRQQELRAELISIRNRQQSSKTSRGGVLEKVKRLDEILKARINESKLARNKVQYKSADEVQQRINELQSRIDAGNMKLVEEKEAFAQISRLNREKKSFAGFDETQKGIDDIKAQIAELRKQLDDPESKALSERYTKVTTELDKIKAEHDEAFKGLNSLRDERTKAREDQQKKWVALREIQDTYYTAKRAATDYEREAKRIREEKRKTENNAYHRGKRQEVAKSKLDDASAPAYQELIRTTEVVLARLDPSSVTKAEAAGPGQFAATNIRSVDSSGIKGTALKKKGEEEENYFMGSGGKKNKRNRGQADSPAPSSPAPAAKGKWSLDLGTISSLAEIGVDPPMSQSDVPAVVEKLKEKRDFWKKDQDRKTKENIANAQKEIDKLEAEANSAESSSSRSTETTRKPAAEKEQANGSASAGAEPAKEEEDTKDVTDDLEKTKIADEPATVEATA